MSELYLSLRNDGFGMECWDIPRSVIMWHKKGTQQYAVTKEDESGITTHHFKGNTAYDEAENKYDQLIKA